MNLFRSVCVLTTLLYVFLSFMPCPAIAAPPRSGKKATTSREPKTTTPVAVRGGTRESRTTVANSTARSASTTIAEEIKRADTQAVVTLSKLAVVVNLSGELSERGDGMRLLVQRPKSLKDLLDLFRRLREDRNVKTVVVRLSALDAGLGTVQELRQAISELRQRGKRTIALLEDESQPAYLVASACEEIVIPPSSIVALVGIRADAYFFRSLLAKLGVHADIVHIGEYKSYGEMFTEDDFTTPARENLTAIVEDAYAQLCEMIATSRKLDRKTVETLIDRGPLTAYEALQAKLVDRVAYANEVQRQLEAAEMSVISDSDYARDSKDKPEDLNLLALLSMLAKPQPSERESKYPQVALLFAVGPIVMESSGGLDLSSQEEIPANDYLNLLDELAKDPKIKGVILRVNSPGGSALASDLIFQKLTEVAKRKPLITSMGDVAASGGYYIAMAGSRIIANPASVTGSIGVVGGKLNLAGAYDKLGIRKTTIARGRFSSLFSETSDFSPEERAMVEKLMRHTYDEFVTKAAHQRRMSWEQIEKVARGKVWTGAQAKEVGLVDELGGMSQAIAEMKIQLGLKPDDKIALVTYPKELTLLDLLQKAVGGSAITASWFPTQFSTAWAETFGVPKAALVLTQTCFRLLSGERVAMLMPYALILR